MAEDTVAFIRALGLDNVDLLGFTPRGSIPQVIGASLVRKMIGK